MTQFQNSKRFRLDHLDFGPSCLFRISCFGFRIYRITFFVLEMNSQIKICEHLFPLKHRFSFFQKGPDRLLMVMGLAQ